MHLFCTVIKHEKLIYIKESFRLNAFINFRVFLPKGAHCCQQHLCDNGEDFNSDAYNLLATIGKENNIFLNAKEIENLLDDLRDACLKEKENQNYNYLERIPKDRFKDEFGISSTDLDNLYNHVKENGTASKMALAAYLMYLRTGQSQAQIASKFRMSQSNFSRYIDTARCDLINIFVPLHLGITNRQVLRDNCTVIAKTLYNLGKENIVTVWDGTYLYLPKSTNFRFQRVTYSGQKKRNLVKPMMCITPNGYIVDVLGPKNLWSANMGDADIFLQIMQTDWFKTTFKPNDIFILDRGFDHVKSELQSNGFCVEVPCNISKGQSQFSEQEANISRRCTKTRWVIECINRRLKEYKYLARMIPLKGVPHLYQDTRIVAALYNAYGKRLYSYDDKPSAANLILENMNKPNLLKELVEQCQLNRQKCRFARLAINEILDFSHFTMDELKKISGAYQLSLAKSYIGDHLYNGEYEFEVMKEDKHPNYQSVGIIIQQPLFIRARMQSRHITKEQCLMYILLDLREQSISCVKHYYCQCKTGARTVYSCAHVLTLIWYLSCDRNNEMLKTPAAFLNRHFPSNLPVEESENSDED